MIIWSPGWSVQLATGGVKTHDQVPVKKSRSRLPFTIDCSCSCKLPLLLEILLSLAFSRDVCKAERLTCRKGLREMLGIWQTP